MKFFLEVSKMLKIDIYRRNLDDIRGLINGARGKVERLEQNSLGDRVEFIYVRLIDTGELERVKRVRAVFKMHENAAFSVSREQFPLIMAYGEKLLQNCYH